MVCHEHTSISVVSGMLLYCGRAHLIDNKHPILRGFHSELHTFFSLLILFAEIICSFSMVISSYLVSAYV